MLKAVRPAVVAAFVATIVLVAPGPGSGGPGIVGATDAGYALCGRVFADPHAYWPSPAQTPARSPYAKGSAVCAAKDFVSYGEMVNGMEYLQSLFPQFVQFYKLERDFGDGSDCTSSTSNADLCSAGLPRQGVPSQRVKSDLYIVRLTDERVADTNKKFFVFPLSIHGIERAGAEAGVRVAEDLATWAYCEAVRGATLLPNGKTNCAQEGAVPHPVLETTPGQSVTAGTRSAAARSGSCSRTRTAGAAATRTTPRASSSATTATASTSTATGRRSATRSVPTHPGRSPSRAASVTCSSRSARAGTAASTFTAS